MSRFLFFLHIPKTAGTSINTIVKLEYRKDAVYPWDNLGYWARIEEFKALPKDDVSKVKCSILKGHYPFGLHKFIASDYTYTTFLRSPVSRTTSHIKQFLGMSNSPISGEVEKMGLDYVLDKYAEYAFSNLQARWISGILKLNAVDDNELFERARHNLDKYFPKFGITERFDESILAMQKEFNWRFPPFYSILNKSSEKEIIDLDISPDMHEKITKLNAVDIRLYEYATKKFDNDLSVDEAELRSFRLKLKYFQKAHNFYLNLKNFVK